MRAFRQRYVVVFLVVLVVSVAVVGYGVFWVIRTNFVHAQWALMFREAQRLRSHLYYAAYLLNNTTIQMNETAQGWFSSELASTRDNFFELSTVLDEGHWRQLYRIESMVGDVRSYWPIFGLNSSMRVFFVQSLRDIGDRVVNAYDIGGDYVHGPSLWYFGPSPPNAALLEEAGQLADDVRETIIGLQTAHLPVQPWATRKEA